MGDVPAPAPRFGRAPGAWPLLGHIVALQRRPLALLDSLPAHGDLVQIRLGPRPAYVVCHPGLARQVLTDFRLFDRTGLVYERVRTAMGNGLASQLQLPTAPGCSAAAAAGGAHLLLEDPGAATVV